jgi:uncharacterized protein (TIGR00251 family)
LKNEKAWSVELAVRVVPGASKNEVAGVKDGVWKVRLTAPPVEGKANRALVEYLADKLDLNKSQVALLTGTASRSKSVAVYGLSKEEIDQKLGK